MFFSSREEVEYMTPLWKGERMEDGRPKVPDSVLERMRRLTFEEVWGYSWTQNYEFQVESDLRTTHSTKNRLVGRALTCICMPMRPDLHQVTKAEATEFGFVGSYNKASVDRLVENDVMVVDFYDKVEYGTYFGGNLSTVVSNKTKNGGAVIWGGIRDLDQVQEIPNLQMYYRGTHPTAIRDYLMAGYNRPCMIGSAICMPGDVVFGSSEGVVFVPAHLAQETVDSAEKSHIRDIFGFQRLEERVYTAAQIDVNPWPAELWADFLNWFKTNPDMKEFQYLNFEQEIEDQKNGVNPFQKRHRGGLPYNP